LKALEENEKNENEEEDGEGEAEKDKELETAKTTPEFIRPLENQQSTQGATCRMDVRLNHHSNDVNIKWLCGDEDVSSCRFSHMKVVSEDDLQSLIITDVKLLDTAQYTCVASNSKGECRCSADLLVLRKSFIQFTI